MRAVDYTPVELAPAFHDAYGRSRHRAVALARAYATTLPNVDEHRQLFQRAAYMKPDERLALIEGYRKAGQGRGVVHAVSQLPRAHGRLIMRDFAVKPDGTDRSSRARDVVLWLRDAGAADPCDAQPVPPATTHDEPSSTSSRTSQMQSPTPSTPSSTRSARRATPSSTRSRTSSTGPPTPIRDLARALLEAFETLGELLVEVVQAGYEVVRKIVKGLEEIGKAMRDILDAAFTLARDGLIMVLRAIDSLGRQLVELLADHRDEGARASSSGRSTRCWRSGSRSATSSSRHSRVGAALVTSVVGALLALGKAVGEILRHRPDAARPAPAADRELAARPRPLAEDDPRHVVAAGADFIRRVAQAAAGSASRSSI